MEREEARRRKYREEKETQSKAENEKIKYIETQKRVDLHTQQQTEHTHRSVNDATFVGKLLDLKKNEKQRRGRKDDLKKLPQKIGEIDFLNVSESVKEEMLCSFEGYTEIRNIIFETPTWDRLVWYIKYATLFFLQSVEQSPTSELSEIDDSAADDVYNFISSTVTSQKSYQDILLLGDLLSHICDKRIVFHEEQPGTSTREQMLPYVFFEWFLQDISVREPTSELFRTALYYWVTISIPLITVTGVKSDILAEFTYMMNDERGTSNPTHTYTLWMILHRIFNEREKQPEKLLADQQAFLQCIRAARSFKSRLGEEASFEEYSTEIIDVLWNNDLYTAKASILTTCMKKEEQNELEMLLNDVNSKNGQKEIIRKQIERAVKELKTYGYPESANPEEIKGKIQNVTSLPMHPSPSSGEESLILTCLMVQHIKGYWPTLAQIVGYCILMSKSNSLLGLRLTEMNHCVTSMVAVTHALQGKHVDIMMTSEDEAKGGVTDWSEFYQAFGLTVSHNTGNLRERGSCITDVIYGTIRSFAKELLDSKVQTNRPYDVLVINDIDVMLLEQGEEVADLVDEFIDNKELQSVEQVLRKIWTIVNRYGQVQDDSARIHFRTKGEPFLIAIDKLMQNFEEYDSIQQLINIAEDHNIFKLDAKHESEFLDDENTSNDDDVTVSYSALRHILQLDEVSEDQIVLFLKSLEAYFPLQFNVYKLQKSGIASAQPASDIYDDDLERVSILLVGHGITCFLHDETPLIRDAVTAVQEELSQIMLEEASKQNSISAKIKGMGSRVHRGLNKHLTQAGMGTTDFVQRFIRGRLATFVTNALIAIQMKAHENYDIQNGQILQKTNNQEPNAGSGFEQEWTDGLQQFLEIKHRMEMSPLLRVRKLLPNIHLFQKFLYRGSILGISRTTGLTIEREVLDDITDGCFVVVPECNHRKLDETSGDILNDEDQWVEHICRRVQTDVVSNKRAALVLCENEKSVEILLKKLNGYENIHLVPMQQESISTNNTDVHHQTLDSGEVIIATNAVLSQTSIDVTESVNAVGGLAVTISYLPTCHHSNWDDFEAVGMDDQHCSVRLLLNREMLISKCLEQSEHETITSFDIQQRLAFQTMIEQIGGNGSSATLSNQDEVDFFTDDGFKQICEMILSDPLDTDELLWFTQFAVAYVLRLSKEDAVRDVTRNFIALLLESTENITDLFHLATALRNLGCRTHNLTQMDTKLGANSFAALLLKELVHMQISRDSSLFLQALNYVIGATIPLVTADVNDTSTGYVDIVEVFCYFLSFDDCGWTSLDVYQIWDISIDIFLNIPQAQKKQNQEVFLNLLETVKHFKISSQDKIHCKGRALTVNDVIRDCKTDLNEARNVIIEHCKNEENKTLQEILHEMDQSSDDESSANLQKIKTVITNAEQDLRKCGYPMKSFTESEKEEFHRLASADCVLRRIQFLKAQTEPTCKDWLVLCSLLVYKTNGYWPRVTQMVTYCLMMMDKHCLLEVGTGEGKSCVIAMVAATYSMRGKQVDIITSSPVLAERDAKDWQRFYEQFGATVSNNVERRESNLLEKAYTSDILYGTVGSFAGDILQTDFAKNDVRKGRRFDLVIVDEVDSMLIDQGVQFTYLSHSIASSGMRHLEPILAHTWAHVSRNAPVCNQYGQVFFRGEAQPFYRIVDQLLQGSEGYDSPEDILHIAQRLGIFTEEDVLNWNKWLVDDGKVKDKIQKVTNEQMHRFFSEMEKYAPVQFQIYEVQGNHIALANHCDDGDDVEKISVLLFDDGLACMLEEDEKTLSINIVNGVKNVVPHNGKQANDKQVDLPNFLRDFARRRIEIWVENAFLAMKMQQGREYIVADGQVFPVDLRSTGVVEQNKKWSNGLQQFLEMKHRLEISPISLVTNFKSNIGLFQQYKATGSILGLSGTLGSPDDKLFMQDIFGVHFIHVPTHKRRKTIEIPGIVFDDESDWKRYICSCLQKELRKGRAALVVCEDIEITESIQLMIQDTVKLSDNDGTPEVKLYARSDNKDEMNYIREKLGPGETIVATNLAGRGTDIKLEDEVINAGGLAVFLTFLPINERVEKQAFGRTGRKGQPGSTQIILSRNHLRPFLRECDSVTHAKELRNDLENVKVNSMKDGEVQIVLLREVLFSEYCKMLSQFQLNKTSNEKNDNRSLKDQDRQSKLNILHESWAVWLIENDKELTNGGDRVKLIKELKSATEKNIESLEILSSPHDNFYHISQFACHRMGHNEFKEAIELFTKSITLEPKWSAIARYNRACCKLKENKSNLVEAISDLEEVIKTINNYKQELMTTVTLLSKSHQDGVPAETTFQTYVHAKCQVLQNWEARAREAKDKLQEISKKGDDVEVETDTLFSLISEPDKETSGVLYECWQMGFLNVFSVKEKPKFSYAALTVFLLGIAQCAIGGILVVVSVGTLSQIGMGLITEGISDCIDGVQGMITGTLDWASWGISKAISIGTSLLTGGIGKIASKGLKLKQGLKAVAKQAKAAKNIVQKEVKETLSIAVRRKMKDVGTLVAQEAVEQGIMKGVEYAEDKLLETLMDQIEKTFKGNISKAIEQEFASGVTYQKIAELYSLDIAESGYGEYRLNDDFVATLSSTADDVVEPYLNQLEWKNQITGSVKGFMDSLKANDSLDKKYKVIFNIVNGVNTLSTLIDSAVVVTKMTKTFTNDVTEQVDRRIQVIKKKMKQTEYTTKEPSPELRGKLTEIFGSKLSKAVITVIHQRTASHLCSYAKQKMNKVVSQHIDSKVTGSSETKNRLAEACDAHRIAYHDESNDDSSATPKSKAAVQNYGKKIRDAQEEGGLLDARVVSDMTKCQVEIYTGDSSEYKLKQAVRSPHVTDDSNKIKLLYTPAKDGKPGHYEPIINGKVVPIQNADNSCFFLSVSLAKNSKASATDTTQAGHELRQQVADRIESNPNEYGGLVQRYNISKELGSWHMAVGGSKVGTGIKTAAQKKQVKKVNPTKKQQQKMKKETAIVGTYNNRKANAKKKGISSVTNQDHSYAYAVLKNPNSKLAKILAGPNPKKSRGGNMMAFTVPIPVHKGFISTGTSLPAGVYRRMLRKALKSNDAVMSAKLAVLGSCTSVKKKVTQQLAAKSKKHVHLEDKKAEKRRQVAMVNETRRRLLEANEGNMMSLAEKKHLNQWIKDEKYLKDNDKVVSQFREECQKQMKKKKKL